MKTAYFNKSIFAVLLTAFMLSGVPSQYAVAQTDDDIEEVEDNGGGLRKIATHFYKDMEGETQPEFALGGL